MSTAAQEEFNDLVAKNTHRETLHPEDRHDPDNQAHDDATEEDEFRNTQIDAAMRANALTTPGAPDIRLPPTSFDQGHSTGVKGVIADARSFEQARRSKWKSRIQTARQSIFGGVDSVSRPQRTTSSNSNSSLSSSPSDGGSAGTDEEAFLEEWRERRRKELEAEASRGIRNRRTSPSARMFGRFDEVDAMGYLDAIEKVGRETKVLVFVYDHECEVSATVEDALVPLVKMHPTIHFVKVHYEDIEFEPAAVPSLLAYHNQGDLFANMTGLIEMIPDEDTFGTAALTKILQQHRVL